MCTEGVFEVVRAGEAEWCVARERVGAMRVRMRVSNLAGEDSQRAPKLSGKIRWIQWCVCYRAQTAIELSSERLEALGLDRTSTRRASRSVLPSNRIKAIKWFHTTRCFLRRF